LPFQLVALLARGDESAYERMARLTKPGRRSAAILFADVQASGLLSRRLPSAVYFRLVRTLISAVDDVVVAHEGIVGRHAGDGATAFFLSEDVGSPSAAARAAIQAARGIRVAVHEAASKIEGETEGLVASKECTVNLGLHWGGSLYMGQLNTGGRLEVTALGDAVNECARIQETARDGELLISKALLENLDSDVAAGLGLDPDALSYISISHIAHASEKAIRDAGGVAVTSL
jgi:class 3 adenylate cyclase